MEEEEKQHNKMGKWKQTWIRTTPCLRPLPTTTIHASNIAATRQTNDEEEKKTRGMAARQVLGSLRSHLPRAGQDGRWRDRQECCDNDERLLAYVQH